MALRNVKMRAGPLAVLSQQVERASQAIPKKGRDALPAALVVLGVVALGLGLRRWRVQATGTFLGVPYDLRFPTPARLRERLWNPVDQRVFTPHLVGWGWSVNLLAVKNRFKPLRKNSSRDRQSFTRRLFHS